MVGFRWSLLKIMIFIMMGSLLVSVASALEISSEDFESNSYSGGTGWSGDWSFSGYCDITHIQTPIDSLHMRGDQCDATRYFDTSLYEDVTISFYAKATSLENNDHCRYYFDDGTIETLLLELVNGDDDGIYHFYQFNISSSETSSFRVDAPTKSDYCYVDNIQVNGEMLNPQLGLYSELKYQNGSLISVDLTSSVLNTAHQFEVYDSFDSIICNETLISPSNPNTIFYGQCLLPDFEQNNAYIKFSTNGANVTKTFNIVGSEVNQDFLYIERIYFSPQVLQGGSTEVFAIIKGNQSVEDVHLTITFPDNTTRTLDMIETTNEDEYRSFITDTFQTGNTSFKIRAEGGVYYDTTENQYYVAPYSVDFVDTVNYVNDILEATIEVHGTEYVAGDPVKIWLQLLDEFGESENNAICTTNIFSPNGGYFVQEGTMLNLGVDGIYFYDFTAPSTQGVYPAIAKCFYDVSQDIEYADSYNINTGTNNGGDLTDTYSSNDLELSIKEENVGSSKRVQAEFVFDDMCGLNVSEILLTGLTFYFEADWVSVINDNLILSYYNFNNSTWIDLPNKVISPNDDNVVTNQVNSNNFTTDGIVNSTGSTIFRLTDTDIGDTGSSIIYLDELKLTCNQYADQEWQEIQGSSEAHIGSFIPDELGYFIQTLDYGHLRNESFLNGFDIHYTIASQTLSVQEDEKILLPLFFPFPSIHTTAVQQFNETTETWFNVSYSTGISDSGRDAIIIYLDLQPETNYRFRTVNGNYWKQKLFSEYTNIVLLNDFISLSCDKYVEELGLVNFTIPYENKQYPNDNFYSSCEKFINAYYNYDMEFNTYYAPLEHINRTFTLDEMLSFESIFLHLEDAGHELVEYGSIMLDTLSNNAEYSMFFQEINDSSYSNYFSNISTGYVNYVKNQENFAGIMGFLSEINYSVSITPGLVWNYSNRTLTASQDSWVGGTEYSLEEEVGKVVVRMSNFVGDPIVGGTCVLDVFYPNNTLYINDQAMVEATGGLVPEGVYVADFNLSGVAGVHPYAVDCDKGGQDYYILNSYHVFDNTRQTNLLEEINQTTNDIYDYLILIDLILDDINETLSNSEYTSLIDIQNDLSYLRTQVDNNDDFTDEMVFLITDSIVATQKAISSEDQKVKKDELEVAQSKLNEFKAVSNEKSNLNFGIIIGFGAFVSFSIILIVKKRKKRNKVESNDSLFDSLIQKQQRGINNE